MYLGQHVSIQGGIDQAIDRGEALGLEAMQIFTTSPKGWSFDMPPEKELDLFQKRWKASNIKKIVAHSIYLVNFASPNPYIYTNSINSLISGLTISDKLGFLGYIIHVGSHKGRGVEYGVERAANALKQALKVHQGKVPIILEISAGAGDTLGRNFDEIKSIIDAVGDERLGVCFDTAHAFESGYDIRTKKGLNDTLTEIDKKIGLEKLLALHLNDSKTDLGSNADRHEDIGKGKIGVEAFRNIINHPKLKDLTGILETPGKEDDKQNITLIKKLRDGKE